MAARGRETVQELVDLLFRTGFGYAASSALSAVIELGIPVLLDQGARPVAELASEARADEDALYRALRLLASLGIFRETGERAFEHTPASHMLRPGVTGSLHDVIRWVCDPHHLRAFADFQHSVRSGRPCFEEVFGKPLFDYLETDPAEFGVFHGAMTNVSEALIPAVLEAYDFEGIRTLADVAGGHGELLCAILARHPMMRGVLCDLDHVLAGAAEAIERHAVGDRIRCEPIDFFETPPPEVDAYLLKNIIHDWHDERARVILRNVLAGMGERRGRVLLLETVLAPGNEPHIGKLFDMEMLALPGGKERTEAEFRALLESAGLRLARILETRLPICVIEAVPS